METATPDFASAGYSNAADYSRYHFSNPTPVASGSDQYKGVDGNMYDNGSMSPTVITDANIREHAIPELTDRINGLSQNPNVTNADGTPYNPSNAGGTPTSTTTPTDTSAYDAILKEYGLTGTDQASIEGSVLNDPSYKSLNDIITSARTSNDELSASTISGIQGKYNRLNADLVAKQAASTNGVQNALLLGGSSRYAPVSSEGIMSEKERYDISTLADLQDRENEAIAAAKSAHNEKDMQLASTLMQNVLKLRSEKQAIAGKINESLATTLNKQKETKIQSAKDDAISNIFAKGTTDVPSIIKEMKAAGYVVTAKEVADTLTNVSKKVGLTDIKSLTGEVKNFAILQENGALPSQITALPEDQQLGAYLQYVKTLKGGSTGSGSGVVKSGTLSIPKSEISEGVKRLDASRGVDHWVDPTVYTNMFQHWVDQGGLPQDFLKQFPTKLYINPSNTSVASYLANPAKKTSTGSIDALAEKLGVK